MLTEEQKQELESFTGQDIIVIRSDGEVTNCIISACCYEVGISVQVKETGAYKLCFHGEKSPLNKEPHPDDFLYDELMEWVYDGVKKGELHTDIARRILAKANPILGFSAVNNNPTAADCAFS